MKRTLWNDNWLFWEDKDAFALIWDVPERAQAVTLPHDAMIAQKARPDSPTRNDGGYRDGGSYVYVKKLFAPEEWRERTVALRFEGVSRNVMVYVNEQRVAAVPYGYTTFYALLNDFLRYGQENEIRVLARTGDAPNSRWYSGGGIYRDVYLEEGGLVYLVPQGLRLTTREASEEMALVEVSAEICSRTPLAQPLEACITLLDAAGVPVARGSVPLTVGGNAGETAELTLAVEHPALWSAESPALYRCRVTLSRGEQVWDRAETAFGIRTVTADARRGMRVNGQPVKLRGACIHHDSGLLGAATYAEAEYRRVRKLKEAGFNALRSAHNPMAPALLEACDALGMYVMDEAFDTWTRSKKDYDYGQFFDSHWRDDLTALVKKDYNHPCVVLYSLGNEIPEIATAQGAGLGRAMRRHVRGLDQTRPVTAGINGVFASGDRLGEIVADVMATKVQGGGNVNDFMTATMMYADEIATHPIISRNLELAGADMDVVGYNYMTARYEPDGKNYPNRVIVGSETYPPEIARNWAIISRCSHVIGDFTWTGWDYIGEAGVGVPAYQPGEGGFGAQYPCQLAYCGDIDITGFRRPASYFREIVFGLRSQPYITVQNPAHYGEQPLMTPWILSDSIASWTHPGFEGKPVVVEVYAPGDAVELLVNGASLGRRPVEGCRTAFETVYAPGTLEAVAYDRGRELGRWTLKTAGAPLGLRARVEPDDGRLAFVDLCLVDGDGMCVPWADVNLTATVEGGTLLGFGSGDPKPLTGYTDGVSRTFQGRALAIVGRGEGTATLTVVPEGYEAVTVTL